MRPQMNQNNGPRPNRPSRPGQPRPSINNARPGARPMQPSMPRAQNPREAGGGPAMGSQASNVAPSRPSRPNLGAQKNTPALNNQMNQMNISNATPKPAPRPSPSVPSNNSRFQAPRGLGNSNQLNSNAPRLPSAPMGRAAQHPRPSPGFNARPNQARLGPKAGGFTPPGVNTQTMPNQIPVQQQARMPMPQQMQGRPGAPRQMQGARPGGPSGVRPMQHPRHGGPRNLQQPRPGTPMQMQGPRHGGPGSGPGFQQFQNGHPAPRPGGIQGPRGAQTGRQSFIPQIELDLKCNCREEFQTVTVSKFPQSSIVHDQSSIPLATVIQPLAQLGADEEPIPVVNFGNVGVIRCKRCRAYINPFVIWLDNGRKWQCNLCPTQNETPPNYYRHLDDKHQRVDKMQRPELSQGCIEIVAPSEYMVRPPMPPVYVFCFEISRESRLSGMLTTAIQAIRESLDSLPGSPRTQVGFLAFDETIHFYNLRADLDSPQVLTVPDLDDLFLPLPEELLVNLQESRATIDKLLDSLEASVNTYIQSESVPQAQNQVYDAGVSLGSALTAAYNVMAHIGGRLNVFASKLPTLGEGKLTPRGANVNILGTMSEHGMLKPNAVGSSTAKTDKADSINNSFYKAKAADYSRQQICCDIFIVPPAQSAYVDLASISEVAKYSGGDCHYYGSEPLHLGLNKLKQDIQRVLTRETGWESVMRVRASTGVVSKGFYGNFLLRGTDLMALPSVSADSAFVVEFGFDTGGGGQEAAGVPLRKDLTGPVTIQTALLYTNSNGERRIRVLTFALPITKSVNEIINTSHLPTIMNLYAKKGVDISMRSGFDDFKRKLQTKTIEIMRAHRSFNSNINASGNAPASLPNGPPNVGGGQQPTVQVDLLLPESLRDLPKMTLGIMKSLAFRGGNEVPLDMRSWLFDEFSRMGNKTSNVTLQPNLYDVLGIQNDTPTPMNASVNNLRADGLFILDAGMMTLLWVGTNVKPATLGDIFGANNIQNIDENQLTNYLLEKFDEYESVPASAPGVKTSMFNFVKTLKTRKPGIPCISLRVVKEGQGYGDHLFRSLLVDDRQQFNGGTMSYDEFLQFLLQQSQGSGGRMQMRR